ncbi:MAG TPA: hypothetical protein DCO82_02395 [Alphaproteobacteria bacterium]|nr:hypothetical protein [Alphaproteobacteria bacterium]
MNLMNLLGGGFMPGAGTPGIDTPSPAPGPGLGGLMSDPSRMMQLQMAANILQASQGQPGQGRPGLGGILGAGAQGALQGGMMANQMQMQQAQMGLLKEKVEAEKQRKKRYEEFVSSPEFQNMDPALRQAIQSGGPELLDKYYTGQVENAVKPPPDAVRQYQYAQEDPAFADYQMQLRRASAPQTTVKLPPMEQEYQKYRGKFNAETANEIEKGAMSAPARMGMLDRLEMSLSNPNVYTGAGGESINNMKRAAEALGFNVQGTSDAEVARAVSNQMALELRNTGSGAGMPGAMSDKDREFLVASAPGLSKSPQGNRMLVDYYRRVENRKVQVAQFLRDYEVRNGRVDSGFYQELANWSARNPLFSEQDMQAARAAAQQAPAEQFRSPAAGTPWDNETQDLIDMYSGDR